MKVPALETFTQVVGNRFAGCLHGFSGGDAKTIESITSSIRFVRKSGPSTHVDDGIVRTYRLSTGFGIAGLGVKMLADIDWATALPRDFPKAKAKSEGGIELWETYMSLTEDSQPVRLLPISKRELTMWFAQYDPRPKPEPDWEDFDYQGFQAHRADRTPRGWEAEWDAVRGGALTMAWKFNQPDSWVSAEDWEKKKIWGSRSLNEYMFLHKAEEEDDGSLELEWDILRKLEVGAFGIDITPNCKKLAGKVRLRCRPGYSGEEVSKQISARLKLMEAEFRQADSDSDFNALVLDLVSEMSEKMHVEPRDSGRDVIAYAFEVNIPGTILDAIARTVTRKKRNSK